MLFTNLKTLSSKIVIPDLSKMLLKDLDKNQFNMTIIEGEKLLNQGRYQKEMI